ncbi:MAG: hypothetical protein Q9170_008226, partial [Blastenia crenularia]
MRIILTLPPSSKIRSPSVESYFQSNIGQIIDEECRYQLSIRKVGRAIVARVLQVPEHPQDASLEIQVANKVFSDFAKDGLIEVTKKFEPAFLQVHSLWELRIGTSDVASQKYIVDISASQYNQDLSERRVGTESHVIRSAFPESDSHEAFLYADVCSEVAKFLESKVHASFNMMAFEASQIAFKARATDKGLHQPTRFKIKLSDVLKQEKSNYGLSPRSTFTLKKTWFFSAEWSNRFQRAQKDLKPLLGQIRVLIALGSNVGDRLGMIEQACMEMARRRLNVLRTSSLYETDPMYKTDQRPFVNGVCEIGTDLPPLELLDQLKDIENALGRVKTIENGPRTIDLDILLYGDQFVNHERLQIPHPRLSEREFVLRPLC